MNGTASLRRTQNTCGPDADLRNNTIAAASLGVPIATEDTESLVPVLTY